LINFTFIDLFSGIGGFHLGLSKYGGECLVFSEIEKNAISAYSVNHDIAENRNLGDITKINDLPKHDLLTAGVPCQSWSIAGKNLGFEDDRGQLWNDTIFLLNKSRPKAFIFENVKGLSDPRNKEALQYIKDRIKNAGYHFKVLILNSVDFGVVQNRVRVYIVGFREKKFLDKFESPVRQESNKKLFDVLDGIESQPIVKAKFTEEQLFGKSVPFSRTRFQKNDEVNDFFLFNDIRNGHSTIHSWDLIETSEEEQELCYLILKNRRKKAFGNRDGNPLSYKHMLSINEGIRFKTIDSLLKKNILKEVVYSFNIEDKNISELTQEEELVLELNSGSNLEVDTLVLNNKKLQTQGVRYAKVVDSLRLKNFITPHEIRYEFKNSKISSGINGINRIYLPNSQVFSTLVASDTNDFVATEYVDFDQISEYKNSFIQQIYNKEKFRKISKVEACRIQGFPEDFILQKKRNVWMKLIGNSVSVPVIENIAKAIIQTEVFKCKS